jgi:hypothetical protein
MKGYFAILKTHKFRRRERKQRGEKKKKKDHAPPTFTSTTSLLRAPRGVPLSTKKGGVSAP